MGLTRRRDGWYVAFPVIDSEDGNTLVLSPGVPGARLKRWKVGGNNKTAAKEYEAVIKLNLIQGKVASEHGAASILTFAALADRYLSLPTIQAQTIYPEKTVCLRERFIPLFGGKLITSITPAMIEDYRTTRKGEAGRGGTTIKPATINRNLALLKHVFSYAVQEGWMEKNPVKRVKFERENNARDRVLTPEEFDHLQHHSSPHLQTINLCAYWTGMRLGEILNLTWDKVDFKSGMVRLKAEDTKTREARLVPLAPELTASLRALYKVRALHEPHVFLVNGKSVGSIKTAFNAACRRAEITGFHFHDFRHTALTNMRRAGIDYLTIMRISGHKTMEVFKRYNSFDMEDLTTAARQLDTLLTLAHSGTNEAASNSA